MNSLEEKILNDGVIINNNILKVDSFINHQIDTNMLCRIAKHIANKFSNVDKILTIETSGIAFAVGTAIEYGNIPVVFAKKSVSQIISTSNVYLADVKSFTRNTVSTIRVDKRFLQPKERVLIVDDFLAEGNAALGLIDILKQANCEIVGVAVCIEKRFQGGRKKIEELGYQVYAGASIDEFVDGKPVFNHSQQIK